MRRHFLTEYFNPIVRFIGYFTTNIFPLKRILTLLIFLLPALASTAQGNSNIEFIQNKGQWNSQVLYKGNIDNGAIFMRNGGFTVVQHNPDDNARMAVYMHGFNPDHSLVKPEDKMTVRSHAWNVDFVGASATARTVAEKPVASYNNYFIGNNPANWASGCGLYQAITIEDVYPNVDVRYYTSNGFLKYDIIAKPGADISKIALKYDGVEKLQVKNKDLLISTSVGQLKESLPYSYQTYLSGRKEISCRYYVKDNVVRFDIKGYDPSAVLVIDPVVIFGSFSGSTADNWGFTATYGPDGSMFGGGIVFDVGFPVSPGAFQTTYQGGVGGPGVATDIGIIKLSPNGNNRVYATYIGGGGNDQPHSLVVDGQGNLVLAGRSNSSNYPITGPGGQIGVGGGQDIVVTKLNPAGTALIGSKKIGGSADDGVNISTTRALQSLQRNYGDDGRSEVILDGAGNIYVASSTQSTNFPVTAGVFQATHRGGTQDAVLLKLTPNVTGLSFASYFGGSGNDAGYVLSLGPGGNIYMAGGTESGNLLGNSAGTVGPNTNGGIDGYITIINNNGTAIIRTAYIGTSGIDQVFGVQFDKNGFPYIMGQTTGTWTVVNATYSNAGGKQFICKLQPDLSAYVYSTMFGSGAPTPNISPIAFLVDQCENVYISGWGGFFFTNNAFGSAGTGGLPITPDAIKNFTDGKDMYFFVLERNALSLLFGSFYGENNSQNGGTDHVDGGTSRFDAQGNIYQAICGNCKLNTAPVNPMPDLVTAGSWSTTNNSPNCQLTMIKIAMNLAGVKGNIQSAIGGVPRDTAGCVPLTVDFIDTIGNAQSYVWNFGDGSPTITTTTPNTSHVYTAVGTYQVMLIAIDPNTCNIRDTSYLNIKVGDLRALLNFDPVKLPPCDSFKYRFDNLSVAPPPRPFGPQSFIWDFGDGSPRIQTGPGSVFHNYAGPGTYNVKLILPDTAYCNSPDSITIPLSVAANVDAQFTTPPTGCLQYNAVFTNTSVAGQTFQWDFGDPASGANNTSTQASPTHVYTTTGTYNIVLIANNPNTCNLTDTFRFSIQVFDAPVPDFNWTPNPPLENTPTTFTNLSSPDAVRFKWDFGDGDSLLTTSRAPLQHQYNATGTFNACLTAYNAAGCDSTICRPVRATILPLVDVPSAFTPLSGDINSVVKVMGFGIGKMQFIIWNRWGQKVFETNNRFQGWDGKVRGVVQPMDVYAYTLSVEFTDGQKTTKKGDITLIR